MLPVDDQAEQDSLEGIAERAGVDPQKGMRLDELRIEPGDQITVLGTVAYGGGYTQVGDGDRRPVVFDGPLDSVRKRVGNRLKFGATLAVVGLIVGTAGTLVTAGLV